MSVSARIALVAPLALAGLGCDQPAKECGGMCGEGTVCDGSKCVVAPAPALDDEEPDPEEPAGKKRRRRRKKASGDAATDGGGLPDRDSHVPRFRADRLEQIGEGSERLSDRSIRQELSTLEPAFDRCLARASEVTDTHLSGTVSFKIGIEPTGKVWGVNASLPKAWGVPGLRACFRNAIYDHRFPSWDGPATGVDYHFTVD